MRLDLFVNLFVGIIYSMRDLNNYAWPAN